MVLVEMNLRNILINLLPKVSEQQKEIIYELIEKWGIPPNQDPRPIFKKGGIHYWETFNKIECLLNEKI